MTNNFTVSISEILLVDEEQFLADGGEQLHFGHVDGDHVQLRAVGSLSAIRRLAREIIAHRGALCGAAIRA